MLQPTDEQEIREIVSQHAASGSALEIVGGGSKQCIGAPRQTTQLSTTRLSSIVDYDPAELILTVQPGARLADVEALLAKHNQMLAFEPWDFAQTAGGNPGRSTIGGIVGAGIAGSRRLSAGSVRDHMLGFHAINGRGEAFKAGGKVVKNVTGYDLPKIAAGSWGQLCILTEITLKVLPRPPETRTLVLHGLSANAAVAAMARALRAPAEVAAAGWLPETDEPSQTLLRLEGFGPSIEARTQLLETLLSSVARVERLAPAEAAERWTWLRTARLPLTAGSHLLWRIVVPPASGAEIVASIEALEGVALLDWAGGLAWALTSRNTHAELIRSVAEQAGGHAMLISPGDTGIPALHPEPPAIAALSQRIRRAFDPAGIFDPNRFGAAP